MLKPNNPTEWDRAYIAGLRQVQDQILANEKDNARTRVLIFLAVAVHMACMLALAVWAVQP